MSKGGIINIRGVTSHNLRETIEIYRSTFHITWLQIVSAHPLYLMIGNNTSLLEIGTHPGSGQIINLSIILADNVVVFEQDILPSKHHLPTEIGLPICHIVDLKPKNDHCFFKIEHTFSIYIGKDGVEVYFTNTHPPTRCISASPNGASFGIDDYDQLVNFWMPFSQQDLMKIKKIWA